MLSTTWPPTGRRIHLPTFSGSLLLVSVFTQSGRKGMPDTTPTAGEIPILLSGKLGTPFDAASLLFIELKIALQTGISNWPGVYLTLSSAKISFLS